MSSCSCLLHMDVIPRGSFFCHHFSVSCLFELSYLVCGAFAVSSVPVFLSCSLSTTHAILMSMLHFDISICFILYNTRLALFYVFCYCQQILWKDLNQQIFLYYQMWGWGDLYTGHRGPRRTIIITIRVEGSLSLVNWHIMPTTIKENFGFNSKKKLKREPFLYFELIRPSVHCVDSKLKDVLSEVGS